MKHLLTSHIPITFVLMCFLWLSFIPTADDFATDEHHIFGVRENNLIKKVHEGHWDIGYTYGDDCLPENRPNQKDLEDAITKALQVWLQPLRGMKTQQPIVNAFRYQLEPPDGAINWRELDLRIRFYCGPPQGRSRALVFGFAQAVIAPPSIRIDRGADVNHPHFMFTLIHELGHAMGMGDTYVRGPKWATKGGLDHTAGTQPAAIMNRHIFPHTGRHLTQDDVNGMMWLYKVTYEGLDPADCFFPNYTFEADPDGCVPKSPLIFEIKQGHETFALDILKDDENIDVNFQDDTGATALHYAIKGEHTEILEVLLAHDDILVHLKSNDGQTPVGLAREVGNKVLAERLLDHPNYALSVAPKGKLATKWASLKQRH